MPMPFDATLKDLVQNFVHDYEVQMRLTEFAPLTPLNVDLSTLTAATDVALGHGDPPDRVVDINFQSGPDDGLAARVLLYNAALHYRYRVPVHSIIVLLRPAADHEHVTGKLHYAGRKRKGRMGFTYEVIRLWQEPVRRYLKGGLGTLPLAPLCRLATEAAIAAAVRKVIGRLEREASPQQQVKLLAATYILSGLRLPRETSKLLFQGIGAMKESSTYQAIVEEGEIKALHKTILRQGKQRFGVPSRNVQGALAEINDRNRLERMTDRLLIVNSWQELLETR